MNNSPNFFSFNNFNRKGENRTKTEWVNRILAGTNSLFIPVCNSKSLFISGPDTRALFYKYDEIKEIDDNEFIFLGEFESNYYFALDVKEEKNYIKHDSSRFDDLRKMAHHLNEKDAAILAYAKAMVYWKGRSKFCGNCGSKTTLEDAGHRVSCLNCNSSFFPHTDPAIIVIVTHGEKCLLARQAVWPSKRYSVIAGFVEPGESLENAVSREVFEETGIKLKDISYHSSQPWPFPGSIMIGFKAESETIDITLHDNELEDAVWLSREEIINDVRQKKLKLSTEISISFRLIEDWFNSNSEIKLRDMLHSDR